MEYWSNSRCHQAVLLTHSFWVNALIQNCEIRKFGIGKRIDVVLWYVATGKAYFDMSSRLGATRECEGQTDTLGHYGGRLHGMVYVNLYSAIVTKVSSALRTLVPREQPSFQALFEGAKVLLCAEVVGQNVPNHRACTANARRPKFRAGVVAQPSVAVWLTGDAAY